MTLLDDVVTRLEAEMAEAGKATQFAALKGALAGGTIAIVEVAAQLGMSEGAVRVAMHRLRERYRVLLRAAVADTVDSPAEIDAELRYLFAALSV